MSLIEQARAALNVDPQRLTRIARKYGIDEQEAIEKLAYRRAVIDRGGDRGAVMALVVTGRFGRA